MARQSAKELARRVPRPERMSPEQIVASAGGTGAALVDAWGRVHGLSAVTLIGRDPERAGIAVLDASVSRHHAEVRQGPGGWRVVDLGSTNGTFLEGKRVAESALLDGQVICVGDVGFAFVAEAEKLSSAATESIRATAASRGGDALRLLATDGGAGLGEHAGQQVSLASTQFALLQLLAARHREERDVAEEVRGFVRSVELCARLPWDTAHPEDNHVKQLVRRVRKALEKIGLPEAVEARHGFGYRLVVGVEEG